MGISMSSISYGDYLASKGIEVFLVDLRGYGQSTIIQEQLASTKAQVTDPMSLQKYYDDLLSSVTYVKQTMGADTEVTLMGFSFLGTLVVTFAHLYPDAVKNVISLNPTWLREEQDPTNDSFNFTTNVDNNAPYVEVNMANIKHRLEVAQPEGKNFIDQTWFDQANTALAMHHKTFDSSTQSWKIHKKISWIKHLTSLNSMKNVKANVLFITAQYDTENPFYLVRRMFNRLGIHNKYLRILPNATHLCIWETARHTLYEWTAEFIL
jgi:alpha-beta hydrolase superfamily lysophospholipase